MNKVPIIVAVDFDGTIATKAWPDLGEPMPGVKEAINKLIAEGYYIIIWTCREGQDLDWIRIWMLKEGIGYHRINEHHPKLLEFYPSEARKICADIYIDDRNLGGLPDNWEEIYQLVTRHSQELRHKCLDV